MGLKCLLRSAASAALFCAAPAIAQLPVVMGEPAAAAKAAQPAARLRIAPAADALTRVELSPLTAAEAERVREANRRASARKPAFDVQRVVIGVTRSVENDVRAPEAAHLAWGRVADGAAAQVSVRAPGAQALRLAIELAGVPEDVEMVFFGSANRDRLEGPVRVGDVRDRTVPWWTPVTEGDSQTIEFFVPASREPRAPGLRVTRASLLLAGPSSGFTKRLEDIGKAGSCNVDIPCSPLASDSAFLGAAQSVAQMVFTDGGFTALCTGQLLNDADSTSQVPWFYSANHCFENESAPYKTAAQMQAVANTLATIWSFEANACGSSAPNPNWTQRSGGATFVYNNVTSDALFLRLGATPPSTAYFTGWDPNPLSAGQDVVAIHHPKGDLKKVSRGTVQGFASTGSGDATGSFAEVLWNSGTTEPGSSGAGLWAASGGQYLFRGGLWGGSALCSNPSGTDYFSRFDRVYSALAQYLGNTGAAVDYTDLWWNPDESGWGLNLIQHPSRIIFAVWYTYALDGKRTWFVMSSGTWTSANSYTGPIYATSGPGYVGAFDASKVARAEVGSATLSFADTNNGTFTYTINGITGTKSISRQPF